MNTYIGDAYADRAAAMARTAEYEEPIIPQFIVPLPVEEILKPVTSTTRVKLNPGDPGYDEAWLELQNTPGGGAPEGATIMVEPPPTIKRTVYVGPDDPRYPQAETKSNVGKWALPVAAAAIAFSLFQ